MNSDDDRVLEFSELLQQSRSRIFGLIYALVLNVADTEDLFQQTASLLWEKFDGFKPGTDFTSWALRVARYKTANFLRSRYREQSWLSSVAIEGIYQASLALDGTPQQAKLDALQSCLNKLPDSDRSLIEQTYSGKKSIKEIAETNNKSAGAIYTALYRIRQTLLICIERTLAMANKPHS